MEKNKTRLLIWILVAVIVLLVGFIGYVFAVQPAITGYAVDRQVEGFQYAILSIMQQATTCQPVPLVAGNQTINVIAIDCLPPELFQSAQE
jgi:hypothetical protein